MKPIKFTIAFVFLFLTFLIQAQNKDFEAYKKAKNAAFKNYVSEQDKYLKAYINDKKAWNKMLLGVDIDVEAEEKEGAEIPVYADLQTTLAREIKSIEVEALKKQSETSTLVIPKKEETEKIEENLPASVIKVEPKIEKEKIENIIAKGKISIPSINPVGTKYRISSKFGYRIHPIHKRKSFHSGIDLACSTGTPVKAPAKGKVTYAGYNGSYGNYIVINHGNGYKTAYAHLLSIGVIKGQMVHKNTIIGKVGSTGASTGSHLHYEVVKNNKKVNPISFLG